MLIAPWVIFVKAWRYIQRIIIKLLYTFLEKSFSKTIPCFKYDFQIATGAKIQIYSTNAVMMVNIYKYLPKSEAAVSTCSLKKLVGSILHNSRENICAETSF